MSSSFHIPKALDSNDLEDTSSTDFTEDVSENVSGIDEYRESIKPGDGHENFQTERFHNDSFDKEMPAFSDDESCDEEYQSYNDEDDFNSDLDDQDKDEGGENDEKEMEDISSEMTEDIKDQLIYSDKNLSDNHIFFVLCNEQTPVVKFRGELQTLKNKVNKARLESCKNSITLEEKLREKEQQFIKLHTRKIMFDKSLPVIEPLSDGIRNNIYKRNNRPPNLFKAIPSMSQRKLKRKLIRLRSHTNKMDAAKNKYVVDMKNYLYHMEREYKDNFMLAKTSEDIEKDKISKFNTKQVYTSLNNTKKPWLHELTIANKKQLMYTRAASTDNQIFYVYNRKRGVKQTKWQCFKLKQHFHEVVAKGNAEEIKIVEKKYRERENYFINTFVNKVQYDDNLPNINPLPLELRNAIYNEMDSIYRVKRGPQQGPMLKALKNLNEVVRQLIKIGNKFAPNVANDLYHKELEYKKSFLQCLDTYQEHQIFQSELSKPFEKRLKKIKREKMSKKAKSKLIKPQIALPQQNSSEFGYGPQNSFKQKAFKNQSGPRGGQKHFRHQGFQNHGNPGYQNRSNEWGFQNESSQGRYENRPNQGDHHQRNQYGFHNRAYQKDSTMQFNQGGFLQMQQNQYGHYKQYRAHSSGNPSHDVPSSRYYPY